VASVSLVASPAMIHRAQRGRRGRVSAQPHDLAVRLLPAETTVEVAASPICF
jgi:hypothetical protein